MLSRQKHRNTQTAAAWRCTHEVRTSLREISDFSEISRCRFLGRWFPIARDPPAGILRQTRHCERPAKGLAMAIVEDMANHISGPGRAG